MRRLEVLERLGFSVKLANGEFFAPQRAEWAFEERCTLVGSCILYARAGDLSATAIVIPRDIGTSAEAVLEQMRCVAPKAALSLLGRQRGLHTVATA